MTDLSMLDMIVKFAEAELLIHANANAALERVAVEVEKAAKAKFGDYQEAVGPFPAWAELADSTKEDRVRLGFTENDPLLRSGDLRNGIEHRTADLETEIGSDDDVMVYQEMGTARMPPRPVLGPSAQENIDTILRETGGAVVAGLIGERRIHASLGYDATVTS